MARVRQPNGQIYEPFQRRALLSERLCAKVTAREKWWLTVLWWLWHETSVRDYFVAKKQTRSGVGAQKTEDFLLR